MNLITNNKYAHHFKQVQNFKIKIEQTINQTIHKSHIMIKNYKIINKLNNVKNKPS